MGKERKLSNKHNKHDSGESGEGQKEALHVARGLGESSVWLEMVLVTCWYLSGIPEKVWEKSGRESDYLLSREAGMYKGPEAGVPGTARKQKVGTK